MPVTKSIYRMPPYQQRLVYEIKEPLKKVFDVFMDPKSSIVARAKAGNDFLKVLKAIDRFPEPTKENTSYHGNTHNLIDIRDYILARLRFPAWLQNLVKRLFKFILIIYASEFYSPFIDAFLWEVKKSDLKPLGPLQPDPHYWDHELK